MCQKQFAFNLVLHIICYARQLGSFRKYPYLIPNRRFYFFFTVHLSLHFMVLHNPSRQEIFTTLSANQNKPKAIMS